MSQDRDLFDMENAELEIVTPQEVPQSVDQAVASKNGNGMIGILVVAIIIIVVLVGGVLLYKYCSAEKPICMGQGTTNQNPNKNQSSSPQKNIQSLDDIEIKSPEEWNAILTGKYPISVVACTMTGCGPCNQIKPALLNAAKKSNNPIHMFNYNGEEWKQGELSKMKVRGFPSVFRMVKGQPPQEYQGDRSEASILRFADTGAA